MNAIRVENLGFSRKNRGIVLDSLSFDIVEGSCVAVLGANGSGKTTLLSLMAGRLKPDSGRVLVGGIPVASLDGRELALKTAFLPQIERLPFNYRVLDFVLMGRAPHVPVLGLPGASDEAVALRALEELGIADLEDRPAGELSGGEFQLARIARCLAQEAPILLLDEPTSMLDPANAHRVASSLAKLARGGRTIIFTTHDLDLTAALAGEVYILHKAAILKRGSPAEVLTEAVLGEAYGIRFGMASRPVASFGGDKA
jgi:iron complex transport system ATP-binding protein